MEWRCPHLLPVSSALPGVFISDPVCALEHGWLVRKPVPLEAERGEGGRGRVQPGARSRCALCARAVPVRGNHIKSVTGKPPGGLGRAGLVIF